MDPKEKKIVNADDSEVLNPMAGIRKYGAGSEDGMKPETGEDDTAADDKPLDTGGMVQDKPFPDELIDPEEQDDKDEMP